MCGRWRGHQQADYGKDRYSGFLDDGAGRVQRMGAPRVGFSRCRQQRLQLHFLDRYSAYVAAKPLHVLHGPVIPRPISRTAGKQMKCAYMHARSVLIGFTTCSVELLLLYVSHHPIDGLYVCWIDSPANVHPGSLDCIVNNFFELGAGGGDRGNGASSSLEIAGHVALALGRHRMHVRDVVPNRAAAPVRPSAGTLRTPENPAATVYSSAAACICVDATYIC